MGKLEDLFASMKEAVEKAKEWKEKAERSLGDIRVTLSTTDEQYNPMRRLINHLMINGEVEIEDLKGVLLPEDIQVTIMKAMSSGKVEWTSDFKIKLKSTGEENDECSEAGSTDRESEEGAAKGS